jgi:IS30 family transposase
MRTGVNRYAVDDAERSKIVRYAKELKLSATLIARRLGRDPKTIQGILREENVPAIRKSSWD